MDQQTFTDLVTGYQPELRAHCYRMLGSLADAEDQVQETLWRAWDRRATYAGRAPVRAWLYRIATNACLDLLRRQPRRGLPVSRQPAADPAGPIPPSINEPIWLEPYPAEVPGPAADEPETKYAQKESVHLAFLTALHLLPPRQRAVLLLADVLDWPTAEIAEALDQTVPSVKSALHRARATLTQHYPAERRAALALPVDEAALRDRVSRYVHAWEAADVEGLVALLKLDCAFSMPPIPSWYVGRANIAALVAKTIFAGPAAGRWRLRPTRANETIGFGLYRRNDAGGYDAYGVQVVSFAGMEIADITTFRVPALVPRFGLPEAISD
jgi:RNA polymerase sigma-70 factor (ECF subfamily)